MEKEIDGEILNVPCHVAIILDGNGRWAKARMMPRNYGHAEGAKTIEQICEDADNLGIKYLTVYAFSTENWKRSVEEVSGIMKILKNHLINSILRANNDNMRVRLIGRREGLEPDIMEKITELEEATKNNTGLQFTIAINYGGRDEIVRAVRKISERVLCGSIKPEDITEDMVSANLDTCDLPDPDLLIRTSGEFRISNFLPWQISYSEFYITDVLWPDFNREELVKAIKHYSKRQRRFGGV